MVQGRGKKNLFKNFKHDRYSNRGRPNTFFDRKQTNTIKSVSKINVTTIGYHRSL